MLLHIEGKNNINFVAEKSKYMYRTHTCGELRIADSGKQVTLSGWVQRVRDKGKMIWIDLRDRYGITQLVAEDGTTDSATLDLIKKIGREYVLQVSGEVIERESKNANMSTGEVEIKILSINILSNSETPPFTIEEESDGGEELRMRYRFLDLRRPNLHRNLMLRHRMAQIVRNYLSDKEFIEVETPFLIKSTPEGARDFVVPSRMHEGKFYALPQSPQLFKQLLMVGGYDRYFQITKCFRDEDFRADRQPEFSQIDCEMAFVEQNDILETFEGLVKHVFKVVKGIDFTEPFQRMTYDEAMERYGNDRPDLRFGMRIVDFTQIVKGKDFKIFDEAEYIGAICAETPTEYTRKQLDALTDFVKRPQIGAKGLVYLKYGTDGSLKSSADKFYSTEELNRWVEALGATPGSLILVLSGDKSQTLSALSELRLEMGTQLNMRDKNKYAPLWVVDFPLFEKDSTTGRLHAMHHPFTSPKKSDLHLLETDPVKVKADAYDIVLNGSEIGGGSVRIFDRSIQSKMFDLLGFSKEEAEAQFGFLLNAFKYGAPPHAGIAFGFDRWVTIFSGSDSIRDVMAFPKNNAGKDIMLDAPAELHDDQLKELSLSVSYQKK